MPEDRVSRIPLDAEVVMPNILDFHKPEIRTGYAIGSNDSPYEALTNGVLLSLENPTERVWVFVQGVSKNGRYLRERRLIYASHLVVTSPDGRNWPWWTLAQMLMHQSGYWKCWQPPGDIATLCKEWHITQPSGWRHGRETVLIEPKKERTETA
jgi:hypothetical protein